MPHEREDRVPTIETKQSPKFRESTFTGLGRGNFMG